MYMEGFRHSENSAKSFKHVNLKSKQSYEIYKNISRAELSTNIPFFQIQDGQIT